jgi:hypothetical protein
MQIHYEVLKQAPDVYMPLIDGFKEVVDIELTHATFTKYA